jgi:hypothetical protein
MLNMTEIEKISIIITKQIQARLKISKRKRKLDKLNVKSTKI